MGLILVWYRLSLTISTSWQAPWMERLVYYSGNFYLDLLLMSLLHGIKY
jgi:hypothetical protein